MKTVPGYSGFEPVEIPWSKYVEYWLPSLKADNQKAGVNWSGRRVQGYDLEPDALRDAVESLMKQLGHDA